jgi:hypothetical protein
MSVPVAIPISKQDIEEIEEIMWRDAPELVERDDMRRTPEWRWAGAGLETLIAVAAWRQQPIEARAAALIDALRAGCLS